MNAKLLGVVVAMSAAGIVVGCGDSGSGGSGGATSATGTGTTTSSSSSSKASSGTGTSTASGTATSSGTGMSCQDTCISMHQTGYALLSQIVVEKCGCTNGGPCNTDCSGDAACTDNMPNMGLPMSGSACETCIQMQAAMGAGSQCVSGAAFDNACQNDADCSAFVTCALGC